MNYQGTNSISPVSTYKPIDCSRPTTGRMYRSDTMFWIHYWPALNKLGFNWVPVSCNKYWFRSSDYKQLRYTCTLCYSWGWMKGILTASQCVMTSILSKIGVKLTIWKYLEHLKHNSNLFSQYLICINLKHLQVLDSCSRRKKVSTDVHI